MSRFKEPSTYAGIAAAIAPFATVPAVAPYAMGASALFGLIGVLLKEGNK